MQICFVRHGETDWNSQSLIQGTINNHLNSNGIKQAEKLGKELLSLNAKWDVIFSSPLSRASQTAEIVAKLIAYKSTIIIDDLLIERDFGNIEGMQLSTKVYDLIIAEEDSSLEKAENLRNRIKLFLDKISLKYPDKKILVFTHSHIIKGLKSIIDPGYSFRTSLSNCASFFIEYSNGQIVEL